MNNKVLVVITSHAAYPSGKKTTGLWFSELTHFYRILSDNGSVLDFASPEGGEVPIDTRSLGWAYMDAAAKRCHDDPMFMGRLENTRRLDEVDPTEYCAVFCTGGHGTLWDFPANDALQTLIRTIYENGGVVAAVCHGSGGLLNVRLSNGEYLIAGRSVTGFSNREETLSLVKKEVPFLLEDAMKRRGAAYRKAALPYTSHAVVDGRLVTGQNPQSTKAVAARVVQLLNDPGNRRQAKG